MFDFSRIILVSAMLASPLVAGTVVISSLPDETHALSPLTSLDGLPLPGGVEVVIGAFSGMSDEELLNAAASGGFANLVSGFVPFGSAKQMGDGVDGSAGNFEIAVQQPLPTGADWVGEEISLLIKKNDGEEFLIARFRGSLFPADPDTGVEPLVSLHLADAEVIVGNRYGSRTLSTSPAPESGSYATWIASFSNIAGESERLPDADADGDGRSNFLEYATGGNPAAPVDQAPCQVVAADDGLWIRFSRANGLGSVLPTIEVSGDLATPWPPLDGVIEPDLDAPVADGVNWMRIRVPQPLGEKDFFRLNAGS